MPDDVKFTFASSNVSLPDVPANLQHGSSFTNVLSNTAITKDLQERSVRASRRAHLYRPRRGQHQIKFGVQFDRRARTSTAAVSSRLSPCTGDSRPLTPPGTRWAVPSATTQVTSNAAIPRQGFITQGNVHTNMLGLFVQDAWSVTNRLTRQSRHPHRARESAGVHDGPASNRIGQYPIDFSFGDKLAPRAGFAYDIKGDGKWKAFGSWGVFYDIFKLDVGLGSFGGAKWVEWYFTLDNPNYESLNANENCPPACSGTFITKSDLRQTSLDPVSDTPVPYAAGVANGHEADALTRGCRSASSTS